MDLQVKLGPLTLKNPLVAASGTYGFGECYGSIVAPETWGAICLKSLTPEPRFGNPGVRMVECRGGLLNSIGLANPGLEGFEREILPRLPGLNTVRVASIAGQTAGEYALLAAKLSAHSAVDALEANLSCPNVVGGGMAFGSDPAAVYKVTGRIRRASRLPLWVKLTPGVTSIADVVRAASDAGADAVVVGNSFLGMEIDVAKRAPVFRRTYAGFSGPPVFPLALRCVHQAARAATVPVVACGGVSSLEDVQKMILAGASAVQLGTVNFARPDAVAGILDGLGRWVEESGFAGITSLVGALSAE